MSKFDRRAVMARAWQIYRGSSGGMEFSDALRRAWCIARAKPINRARINEAKKAAGVTEEVLTWKAWKDRGFEVKRGSRCLFQVQLIHASRGEGAAPYKASFFGASQVRRIPAAG